MNLNLSNISSEPLHQQISRQVRERILSGELPAGTSLPSIRGLAAECRVSVITVQRAYDDLFREGIIEAQRGRGFFVCHISRQDRLLTARNRFAEKMGDLIESAKAEGLDDSEIRRISEQLIGNQKPK